MNMNLPHNESEQLVANTFQPIHQNYFRLDEGEKRNQQYGVYERPNDVIVLDPLFIINNGASRSINPGQPDNSALNPHQLNFIEHSQWDGYVEHIGEETFFVNFVDKNDEFNVPKYQVEFQKSDLSEIDKANLEEDAFVRWEVGIERHWDGKYKRFSMLYLIEMPPITKTEVENARLEAKKILNGINWDEAS